MTVIIVFTGIIYEIRFTDSQKTSANPVAVGEIAVMNMKEIFLERFLNREACFAGSAEAFIRSLIVTILWAGISPLFGFSKIRQPIIIIKITIAIFNGFLYPESLQKKFPESGKAKL